MTHKIKLEIFEGPLDLLLYLIKKEEINIYDIPIAKITEQYLEYLGLMQLLDLKMAGEFLVMASTLMQIKSRMLLPPDEQELEEEEEDPRAELVRRLLEYRKFKEAAGRLEDLEGEQAKTFRRKVLTDAKGEGGETYFEASLFDLIAAFSKILKTVPREQFLEIMREEFTVEKKVHDLLHLLVATPILYFSKLFERAKSKIEIITTFLAVLELIRMKEIMIRQKDSFTEIEILRHPEHMQVKTN
ncbi:MAG: segregation/condensation protein A [Candidatus Omnitrophota bacterium]